MGEIELDVPFRLRSDVVATVLDDGALLLDLESKYFYLLNPSGWAITQLFESGTLAGARPIGVCRGGCRRDAPDRRLRGRPGRRSAPGGLPSGDIAPRFELTGTWSAPTYEKQLEPLQRVIVNAFDPTIPLAE